MSGDGKTPLEREGPGARNGPGKPSYSHMKSERGAPANTWSDEALMAAYQQGDPRAFELLFERYKGRLYGYFVRRLNDRELAADLFQRTFLRVHRARGDYDASRSFAAWTFGIASNLAKDEFKRRTRRPGDAPGAAPEDAPGRAAPGADPESELLSRERAARVESALAALPDSQREVIVLHKVEGLSFPEIAEALGENVEAVKSRAFRGYRALRRLLATDQGERPR